MATLAELVGDAATNAQHAQAAHAEVVKMVMATVDLLDLSQRGEASPDIAQLRRHIGRALRRSGAKHAVAVASLILDSAPEYAEELADYSEEIYPETDQEGGEA